MYSSHQIQVDFDKTLYVLFCCYAFSMPFELILEKLFYIDTIFKPFRIFSILIIGTYALRSLRKGLQFMREEQSDVFLYLVFLYGILASSVQAVMNVFNTKFFYSDLLLIGLHVLTFWVYKSIPISKKQALRILYFFILGIVINAVYIYANILLQMTTSGRQAGFIDNPNYASLGLVAAMFYFLLRSGFDRRFWHQVFYILMPLFLLYIFIITGSRTGLITLVISLFFLFLFSSFRRKLFLLAIGGFMVFYLSSNTSNLLSSGGTGTTLVLLKRIDKKMNSDEEDVRFVIWRGIFTVLEDRGYWGMGIGQFKANFSKYYGEESNGLILEIVNRGYHLSPHNDYLAILVDYGIPSLLFYALFLYYGMRKIVRRVLYPVEDDSARFIYQYAFVVLSCLIVFGITAENFPHQLFWFLLMFSTKSY